MNNFVLLSFQKNLRQLIKKDASHFLKLLEYWCEYDKSYLDIAIDVIFENSDDLTNEFFDRFLEILDRYNKTELALICVRHWIERKKKEQFEL